MKKNKFKKLAQEVIESEIKSLNKFGLKIRIYDDNELKKLGMNTLLGVGQGSIRGSYLVTMEEWAEG